MQRNLTPVSSGEVLPASLTKQETDSIERKAVKLFSTMEKTSILFAMELRKLQEGGAHLVRGYPNFGSYVEATFEGVSAVNAAAISRQGRVLLVLEQHGRLDKDNLPGTTGVRSLAKILKDFGESVMIQVYDRALEYERKVTDETVLAATRELIAPQVHELGEGSVEEIEEEGAEPDEVELSEEVEALLEQLGDCLHDVRFSLLEGQDPLKFFLELREKVPELEKAAMSQHEKK